MASHWHSRCTFSVAIPLEKDENLLKTIGYFWSDALNCFLFRHGPMTPTLMDVVMITGVYIESASVTPRPLPDRRYLLLEAL
jgi:hypothetical protein